MLILTRKYKGEFLPQVHTYKYLAIDCKVALFKGQMLKLDSPWFFVSLWNVAIATALGLVFI